MKKTLRIVLNLFLVVLVPWQWLRMALGASGGTLSSVGLGSLKYFTVLSNWLEALASLGFLLCALTKRREETAAKIKYVAAVSVGLTFSVVMLFLGPLFGYGGMFRGANFWFHLGVPLLAMGETVFLEEQPADAKTNRWAVAPMLLYGVAYVGNNLINGIGAWPRTNDWYAFLTWGYPIGILIFFAILAITYGIGFLLRKGNAAANR